MSNGGLSRTIYCDFRGCDEFVKIYGPDAVTYASARHFAVIDHGWNASKTSRKDFCPDHWDEGDLPL